MTPNPQRSPVPVIDRVGAPELRALLESPPVQQLIAGRIHAVHLVDVRSYAGKAFMGHRGFGATLRGVRLRAHGWTEQSECVFVLCHELAHHMAGLQEQHSRRWREVCAELVREAGELGLLTSERVAQAVAMVMEGAASRFRGWPERAAEEERAGTDARREAVSQMCAAGLEPGAQVQFRYRGKLYRGEVVRINPKTVTVGEPGKGRGLLRVPYERILGVIPREQG